MAIQNNYPSIRPSLNLDFANTKRLDPRLTFTRASNGTYYDAQGVLRTAASGVPRFTHNPVTGESLGLLMEQQSTNLCLRSQELNLWSTQNGATVTANTTIAPDGTLTADTVTGGGLSSTGVFNTVTFTGDGEKCVSVFVKAGTAPTTDLTVVDTTGGFAFRHYLRVTWNAGVPSLSTLAGSGTLFPPEAIGNGWYRIVFSVSNVVAANSNALVIYPDTTTNNGSVIVWGVQAENLTRATSYIKTEAATVTRSAETCQMTGTNFSSWYRADEGTMYADVAFLAPISVGSSQAIFDIHDGTINNRMHMFRANGTFSFYVNTSGTNVVAIDLQGTVTSARGAASYAVNNFAAVRDAGMVGADTSGTVPVTIRLHIGTGYNGSFPVNGTIRKLAYYPVRLTDAQLQAITG